MSSPISKIGFDVMGVLFVYDCDLFIMSDEMKEARQVWAQAQEATTAWGNLLISTGGILKPPKCFSYMVDYEWEAGEWKYADLVFFY